MNETMNITSGEDVVISYVEDWPNHGSAMMIVIAIFQLFGCMVSLFCLVGILSTKARKQGYNLFLVFLLLPDSMYNGMWPIWNILRAVNDRKAPVPFVLTTFWILFFYFCVNFWLNAVISFEIYTILNQAKRLRNARPTSQRNALIKGSLVYLMSALYATWIVVTVPWSPYNFVGDIRNGVVWPASKVAGRIQRTIAILVPILCMACIACIVWKRKLLPTRGRTRVIYFYFLKVFFIFFGFYVPTYIIAEVIARVKSETRFWLFCVNDVLAVLQTLTTSYLVMSKNDVYKAIVDAYPCCSPIIQKIWGSSSEATRKKSRSDQSAQRLGQSTHVTNESTQNQNEWTAPDVYENDATEDNANSA